MAIKYWVADNPNSEINDTKAQKLAELSATTASLADLDNIASSAATAAERDYRTMVVDCGNAAGSGSVYAVIPYNCNVLTAHLVLQGAENGSGTYGLALENNASTAMGSGAFTVATSAAAGTIYSVTPATNNSFTAGQKIEFLKSSSSGGGTPGLMVTLVLELT